MKNVLLFIMLCIAPIGFAQVKVNSAGNTGMGDDPNLKAKLLLYNTAVTDTIFGLQTTVDAMNSNTQTQYSIYSNNINNSSSPSKMYGAYFKNRQLYTNLYSSGTTYGIYLDNQSNHYSNSCYGVYTNNNVGGYASSVYGYYADNNISGGYTESLYGYYANNISDAGSYSGNVYGAYLNNSKTAGNFGNVYGIYSTNSMNISLSGSVYGAYLSATSLNKGGVYGIYSTVSGGDAINRYAGFFTGGKVEVNEDFYAWDIYANNVKLNSDERLKSDIKPLSDEKERLYLLQGKSYKKTLPPTTGLVEDSLAEKRELVEEREIVETPEYGYLAQELKEIFPDLVSQRFDGYYAVNYIGLIPVIVEALKDQRLENEKQQIQIEEQREQIKQLVKLMNIKSIDEKIFEENGIESIPLLLQNTPNPFNQVTEIGYYIPETVNSANIYIYDINGFQQRNISISGRGKGATILQASALQAGIYFYTLICDGKPVDTKQMILTR